MDYVRIKEGDVIRLTPQSDLKTADSREFEERLLAELAKTGKLTVDMSCVGYICSSGLRALLAAQQAVDEKEEGELVFVNITDEVMSVLRSTGFCNILTII